LPCWTPFPHPRYSSLGALFNRFTALSSNGSTNIPKVVLIENGVHVIDGRYVTIKIPISIVGESREHCIVIGGLWMNGKKEDDVNVSNLTLRKSKGDGVCNGYNGASMHLDNMSVENSGSIGVSVFGSKRNTMKNCNVSHSKGHGLYVYNGLMTIDGNATTIHQNGSDGYGHYGLETYSSSSILLVSPLTKEMISTNNHHGRNYSGPIQTITINNTNTGGAKPVMFGSVGGGGNTLSDGAFAAPTNNKPRRRVKLVRRPKKKANEAASASNNQLIASSGKNKASTSESTMQFGVSTNGSTGSTGSNKTTTTTTAAAATNSTSKESPASVFTFGQTTTTKPVSMNEKKEEGDGAKDQTAFSFGAENASVFSFGQTTTTKPVSMNEKKKEGDGASSFGTTELKPSTSAESDTPPVFVFGST